LYGTTDAFLRTLNISSLSELPPLPKDEANEESADEAGEDE
jgi:chromosome segregation and condensation protein ScpB